MKCFYHKSDFDGKCSAAIIKQKHSECQMIGVDYLDKLDDVLDAFPVEFKETVFVVDFAFQPYSDMEKLSERAHLFWFDHHKTTIEWSHDNGFLASGGQLLDTSFAGCELTWKFLYPDIPIPYAVRMLGRYDVWDHKDPEVLHFQYGMRQLKDTHPENECWYLILRSQSHSEGIMRSGKSIVEYETYQNKKYAKGMYFETSFEGLRAIVINKAYTNSLIFDSVYDPEKHDIMILFGVKPNKWKYSLYSDKPEIDVSVIAAKYGGGGHKGAAGFFADGWVF